MAFCSNCGSKIVDGAKFCQKCGCVVSESAYGANTKLQQEFSGKIYKCPNCGEILNSFVANCPSCGFELRGTKATSAVLEFSLKLEAIESRREYEKPTWIFARVTAMQQVSKTDEQKVSLIKNFSVPNTKEDILEFMILATSNIDTSVYGSTDTPTASAKAIAGAWDAKIKQVYAKAKNLYGSDPDFSKIQKLYDLCYTDIGKQKKKKTLKYLLLFGWVPVFFVVIFLWIAIYSPISEKKEVARLDTIVDEIEIQLENREYKYALMNAETLVYDGTIWNKEQERKWTIQREYWIDKVIEEASENGVTLERPTEEVTDDSTSKSSTDGVTTGFNSVDSEGI